ncbi:MAG: glycosyltransferase family 4 protein [Acidimicrobiales bacterium]
MILTFLAPSTRHPVGGNTLIYEFATAMAERGHDVHLYHHEIFGGDAITSVDEIGWYEFRANITHHVAGIEGFDPREVVSGDIYFGYTPLIEDNPRYGLPVCFVQGHQMYPEAQERQTYLNPCPKICVASWLVRVGLEYGVPPAQLVHIPNGLKQACLDTTRAIEGRRPRVLFCYNSHLSKGAPLGLEVLTRLHDRRPDLDIVAFGGLAPDTDFPDWLTFHHDPDQTTLIDGLYNTSTVFLWTSRIEGFGLPALEAMAGGAALVTTDNGGSEDYAFHGETALVADYPDADALLDNVERLLDDERLRHRLAAAGRRLAAGFTWEASADRLEAFVHEYREDPQRYGRPA